MCPMYEIYVSSTLSAIGIIADLVSAQHAIRFTVFVVPGTTCTLEQVFRFSKKREIDELGQLTHVWFAFSHEAAGVDVVGPTPKRRTPVAAEKITRRILIMLLSRRSSSNKV